MFAYYLLLFFASAGIMILELVAGRLMAPYLGVSLYTWTSVIGVVLAGMSLGAFAGGWLADRFHPRRLLSWVLVLSSVAAAAILALLPTVSRMRIPPALDIGVSVPLPAAAVVFVPVLLLFLVPSFCLGLVAPIVYKLALDDLSHLGGAVGRLSAAGILGSIAGTFATGFWLVPAFGSRPVVLGVAVAMLLLGAAVGSWRMRIVPALLLAIAVVQISQRPALLRSGCDTESAYYCIRISWAYAVDDGSVKQLVLDRLVHSGADILHPNSLWYDYEKVFAWIVQSWNKPGARAFFIGGGGYAFPHWLERNVPGAQVEVAEIDPEVTATALREFVGAETHIVTYNSDARLALRDLPADVRYDLVIGDAFNDISVPYHLTTREFADVIRQRLTPDGMYLVNVVDRPDGAFVGAFMRTLRQAFPHVYLMPGDATWNGRSHSPQVLVASLRPLPWAEWRQTAAKGAYAPELLPDPPGDLLLTDDYAPVDNMLLQIFGERLRR